MKFYKISIIVATLFQSFLCTPMDDPRDRAIIDSSSSDEEPLNFPTSIPEDYNNFFPNPDKKLKFPPKAKKELLKECLNIRIQKNLQKEKLIHEEIEKAVILQQEKLILEQKQQENALLRESLIVENNSLRQTCLALEKRSEELLQTTQYVKSLKVQHNKIPEGFKQLPQQKKNAAEKNKLPLVYKSAKSTSPIQSLMQQFGATDIACLKHRLCHVCADIKNGERRNDCLYGPYFHKKNGLLYGPINTAHSYTFSPQFSKLTFQNHPFSTFDIATSSESSSTHSDTELEHL